jgi:hypothetical protein
MRVRTDEREQPQKDDHERKRQESRRDENTCSRFDFANRHFICGGCNGCGGYNLSIGISAGRSARNISCIRNCRNACSARNRRSARAPNKPISKASRLALGGVGLCDRGHGGGMRRRHLVFP